MTILWYEDEVLIAMVNNKNLLFCYFLLVKSVWNNLLRCFHVVLFWVVTLALTFWIIVFIFCRRARTPSQNSEEKRSNIFLFIISLYAISIRGFTSSLYCFYVRKGPLWPMPVSNPPALSSSISQRSNLTIGVLLLLTFLYEKSSERPHLLTFFTTVFFFTSARSVFALFDCPVHVSRRAVSR